MKSCADYTQNPVVNTPLSDISAVFEPKQALGVSTADLAPVADADLFGPIPDAPAAPLEAVERAPTLVEVATRRKPQAGGRGKSQKSLALVDFAYTLLAEIRPATVRTVAYKAFVAGLSPDMSKNSVSKISTQLVWARENSVIPWAWIVDEIRKREQCNSWESPAELFEAAAQQYRRDNWAEQPQRLEVWSEKGTVRRVLEPVLEKYGVAFQVIHGFAGAATMWDVAQDSARSEKPFTILYVGDFDPSGMCISDIDIPKRLERYAGRAVVKRIALTPDDVLAGTSLPHFDAATKKTDSRHDWFVRRYGTKCWELDAMSPVDLRERVADAIWLMLDHDVWNRALLTEKAERDAVNQYVGAIQKSISGLGAKYSTTTGVAR